jgi:hypothetical protein
MISGNNSNAIYEASFMEEIYLQQGWPLFSFTNSGFKVKIKVMLVILPSASLL